MSTIPSQERDPALVLTRNSARRRGMPLRQLLGPSYQRVFFDAYVPRGVAITPTLRSRVALRLLAHPARIRHHTAVQLWGGVAPHTTSTHVTVSERDHRIRRMGITAHYDPTPGVASVHKGMLLSPPVQSWLELAAAGVPLVDLVVAADSLVTAAQILPQDFVVAANAWTGRNARLARRAARLVRAGVDSAMETRLRLLIVLAGLPEPEVNLVLRDDQGNWVLRFDLCYREHKLILEYDGRQHAESDIQWGRDIERRELLDHLGWRLLVIRADGVFTHPERTLVKVQDALRDRRASGVPARFRPEWVRHFPSRV